MNSNDKREIMAELDAAIDAMDMSGIERGLTALSGEASAIEAEDALLFSARIQELNKEARKMHKPRTIIKAAIVAAAVLLTGLSVYAAAARLNLFSFQQGDRFVTMRTTEDITEQQAREMIGETPDAPTPAEVVSPPVIDFDDVEQAQAEMDIVLVLPSAMPDMALSSVSGQRFDMGNGGEQRTVWLTYADEAGRLFAVTSTRTILPTGVTAYTTHDIDDGSLGSYKSKTGVEYTLLSESDDTGERTAHLAVALIGEYEYALGFFNFDEAERKAVIDSTDLSGLQTDTK